MFNSRKAYMGGMERGYLGGSAAAIIRMHSLFQDIVRTDEYILKGITEPFFRGLNNQRCILYREKVIRYKRYLNGKLIVDAKSNKVLEHVPVPQKSLAVITDAAVNKPKELYNAKSKTGYRFIDIVKCDNRNFYRYIVPAQNIYRVNFVSLVVSQTRLRNHLGGVVVYTIDNEPLYLFCTAYNSANNHYTIFIGDTLQDVQAALSTTLMVMLNNNLIMDFSLLKDDGTYLAFRDIPATVTDYEVGVSSSPMVTTSLSELAVLI